MFLKLKASPRFARKEHHQITGSGMDERDRIIAGVRFTVYYIGSTEVAGMNGTGSGNTAKPVAQVFDLQRKNANRQTLRELIVAVCSKNLSVSDEGKLVASFPISKITFCNIDNIYERAFVFVARDKPENPFKAFVFTCESKTKAIEAYKALSLAFIINYECYQASLARAALNGKAGDGGSSLNSNNESDNTYFDGLVEAGYEMKPTKGSSQQSEQFQCNSVMPLRKESFSPILNDFDPSQERILALPRTQPIQNKTLLQVADCNSRIRSVSDPTQFGKTKPSLAATSNTRASGPNNGVDAEIEDAEFTEFAELRMRSSTLNVADSHPIRYG